jgi:3,4-dehydroadipyl-CoA semialdehyde dehydrogenase
MELSHYLEGAFRSGSGDAATLVNPSTTEAIATVRPPSGSFAGVLAHARDVGGPALRALTFAQRAEKLAALAKVVHQKRDELIALAVENAGNTRGDAKFDIDGAAGSLAHYAELGAALGDRRVLLDGDSVALGRSARLVGQHARFPRLGAAVLVNAFNFPAWGIAEKAACAWLAGVPVVAKPATSTALVAHRLVAAWIEAGILPDGALQLAIGVGDLLDVLDGRDVLAFTGSSATGQKLRSHPGVLAHGVRVNVEADSLNAAVLAPDVALGEATWDLFVNEVSRDVTQKTGQKCTAIRRILVPRDRVADVAEALGQRFAAIRVGDPKQEGITMGPVVTAAQLADVRRGIERLAAGAKVHVAPRAVEGAGYFVSPVLLESESDLPHQLEVFGPVTTIVPYDGTAAHASALVARGAGSLVASIYGDDRAFLRDVVLAVAPHHGRLYLGSAKVAGQTAGPGTALPQLLHGGPGRAGGGEELGGLRGLALYQQRTAISGDKALLDAILG